MWTLVFDTIIFRTLSETVLEGSLQSEPVSEAGSPCRCFCHFRFLFVPMRLVKFGNFVSSDHSLVITYCYFLPVAVSFVNKLLSIHLYLLVFVPSWWKGTEWN